MIEATDKKMIEFKPIQPSDRELYERYFALAGERGCEFSFANLYIWGRQSFAEVSGHVALFSQFNRRTVYPYPVGGGDKKEIIDRIIADASARGIPCRITGLSDEARDQLAALYPDRFRFHSDEGSYDYVYRVEDLAELKGRKYHSKRNHLTRFYEAYPDFRVEPLCDDNLHVARELCDDWYREKLSENPDADFHMERAALDKAFRHFGELSMMGLLLFVGDRAVAFTMASRMTENMLDVHFEKARSDVGGAYAAINCEFAKFVMGEYPEIEYLDREEDMGIEGLRRAKRSYNPIRQIRKSWACLLEDGYDY